MVGVPGKYKGCETCRRRRVKCSNERPFCKKCANSGRECEGYERDRVFITGTLETKGRVASHPKKTSGRSTPLPTTRRDEKQWRRSRSRSEASSSPSVQPLGPSPSAWEEFIPMTENGVEFYSTMAALHTRLENVEPHDHFRDEQPFKGSLPLPKVAQLPSNRTTPVADTASPFLRCTRPDKGASPELRSSYHVFLSELQYDYGAAPTWSINDHAQTKAVRALGPRHFQTLPTHEFFARVYRPTALSLSLLGRQETFLATLEWMTKPWEQQQPKSLMDELIDAALLLPSLLVQLDKLTLEPPTTSRREQATKLLQDCVTVERQFDAWLFKAFPGTVTQPADHWPVDPDASSMLPFPFAWAFKNGSTGILFLYYWMTQIVFHQCITAAHAAVFEAVIDVYPDVWAPVLPPTLQTLDMSRYQQTRELGANICRGLDAVLAVTGQPDLLLGPLRVATDLFRQINSASNDAVLEVMWLEGFGEKIRARGQDMSDTLQEQRWAEMSQSVV